MFEAIEEALAEFKATLDAFRNSKKTPYQIEKAKELYDSLDPGDRSLLEYIFPEVVETEDERIRKALIDGVRQIRCKNGITQEQMLAYLEKQKEQKELPLMDGNADLYFDEWNQQKQNPTKRQCFEEGMRYAERLQKEQKPDDQYVHGYYEGFSDSAKAYRPAEWSEEDKKFIKHCAELLDGQGQPMCALRLESLPERFNLQPKQEWSEEDEKLLDFWLDVIDRNDWRMDENFCKASREFINRLKSLSSQHQPKNPVLSEKEIVCLKRVLDFVRKEHNKYTGVDFTNEIAVLEWMITHPTMVFSYQPHWKPSEEQMKALKEVAYSLVGTGTQTDVYLVQLYEQLKKLK